MPEPCRLTVASNVGHTYAHDRFPCCIQDELGRIAATFHNFGPHELHQLRTLSSDKPICNPAYMDQLANNRANATVPVVGSIMESQRE
jgi:hypothetical protein